MQSEIIALAIMAVCVLFFVTRWLPAAVTGTAGCCLMVLLKVCSFEDAFSGFSNSIVVLMISSMIVGIAMFKTGAAQILGQTIIRLAHGSERIFLLAAIAISGVSAMFLANTAILSALIPVVDSVCTLSPQMKRRNLLLPLACAVMLGGACTLIGCTPQLTANALLMRMTSMEMTMWTMTAPGICIFLAFIVYMFFRGQKDADRIWGDREETPMNIEQEKIDSVLKGYINKKKMPWMMGILIAMIVSYAFSLLPTAETALCAALLCILTGCCTTKDIIKELHWESVFFLGSCLGLGNALTVAGTGDLIGHYVSGMLAGVAHPYFIFVILTILTMFLSQFITNSTAIIIVLPIALSLCGVYGLNPMTFCVGITFAASLACCTPLAAAQITMTQIAGYRFSDYAKFGWKPSLVFLCAILVLVPIFFPIV